MSKYLKKPRKPRLKPVRVQRVDRPAKKSKDEACPYFFIDALVKEWHPDLEKARIGAAWLHDVKPDMDGHLTLGRCKKATDLDREYRDLDLVILLNAVAWKQLTVKQREALVDHELCHAGLARDKKSGEPIKDERDRLVYRLRRHDVEEFHAVVKRHGCYVADISILARQALQSPLFKSEANGEAGAK